ncbi:MAG: CYTH and CHAD domain-containing protein [Nitrosomonas sp.]|nr:CYTH and CHAD domain-containing protein [Nitrosomonas sp.]
MAQELELKLALRPRCLKQVVDLSWLKQFQISVLSKHKLYSIYFDTPDLALKTNNCSLRIRRDGNQWMQTIKSGGQITAGLHQHDEWEILLDDAHPDLRNIPDLNIRKLFRSPGLRAALQPVFVTQFTRRMQLLKLARGSTIELCLDHGKIIVDKQTESISEIELELKSGDPLELLDFSQMFIDNLPCTPRLENLNKAERGYRLYSHYSLAPCKAGDISFMPGVSLHLALKMIVQDCLEQLAKNEKGFLTVSDDIEYLHQMRVALRRLRAAFRILQQVFPNAGLSPLQKALKWLTRQLNPARDWDILVTETLPRAATSLPHPVLHLIGKQCRQLRETHRRHARVSINSLRYTRLLIQLCSWLYKIDQDDMLTRSGEPHPDVAHENARVTVISLIADAHQKIIRDGKSMNMLEAESLHVLRIHIKELRYLIEFFHSLFPRNACKQQIAALSKLQDILGSINDCTVTQHLLDEIQIGKQTNKQAEAIGIIRGWTFQRIEMQKLTLKETWENYVKSKPFW